MPKTPHPKKLYSSSSEILTSQHFTSGQNTHATKEQANVTYMIDATAGSIGVGGETQGFGKVHAPKLTKKAAMASERLFPYTSKELRNDLYIGGDRGLIHRQVLSYEADKFLGLNSVSQEKYAKDANLGLMGVSMQADGVGVLSKNGLLDADYTDPRIQRGLSDLGVSDFITGQMDRHPGNIFIDPVTGKVTGIDNDLSFPEVDPLTVMGEAEDRVNTMPDIIHQETADKIINTDPEEFRKLLKQSPPKGGPQKLSDVAIDGAVNRLVALQNELNNPTGKVTVVQQFNRQTYDLAIQHQDASFIVKHGKNVPRESYLDPTLKFTDDWHMNDMSNCRKTSYLGAIMMEHSKNRLLDNPLPLVTAGVPLVRDQDAAKLKTMADGYAKMTKTQKQAFDQQFEQLNKLEEQLATKQKHLVKPSLTDKFKGLVGTGINDVLRNKQQNADNLEQQIDTLKTQLLNKAEQVLGPAVQGPQNPVLMSTQLDGVAQQYANNRQQQQQQLPQVNQVQVDDQSESVDDDVDDLDQSEDLDENVSQEIDGDEQEVEGVDNLDGNDQEVEDVDDLEVDKQEVEDVGKLKVDDQDEQDIEVEEQDVDDIQVEKPSLERRNSVREIMKENQVVKRAKTQLGLEQEGTTRSNVKVTEPKPKSNATVKTGPGY